VPENTHAKTFGITWNAHAFFVPWPVDQQKVGVFKRLDEEL